MHDRVIGPYFFKNGEGEAITVNGERYRYMIDTFLRPAVNAIDNHHSLCFQQDGATCHTARQTMDNLRQIFGNQIISCGGDINWPSRSPDLTALDFFLWRYLKERVSINKPWTVDALKQNITDEIRGISQATLCVVMDNVLLRAQSCIAAQSQYLSDVVLHM